MKRWRNRSRLPSALFKPLEKGIWLLVYLVIWLLKNEEKVPKKTNYQITK